MIGARIGRNQELDPVHAMRAPAFLGQFHHRSAQTGGVELERGELARHRRIEPQRRLHPQIVQAPRLRLVALTGPARGVLERIEFGLAALDRIERGAHPPHRLGQFVHFAAVLAGDRAQLEQPRLGGVERGGIVIERFGGALQPLLGLARLDHRAVERGERLGQQRMLLGDPVEPPRRHAQRRQRRVRAFPDMAQFLEIARQLLALLHRRAGPGEPRFLAGLRFERGQLRQMRKQQILIGLGLVEPLARLFQPLLRPSPCAPCRSQRGSIRPGIAVEQQPMAARIDQPAIVVLAVQFDQMRRQFAQQRDACRLIVDPRLAPAIGLQLAADQQRLARLELEPGLVQRLGHGRRQRGELESAGDTCLVFPTADQRAFRAIAQHQPQRVEQDRLARPGFAGEHA